MAEVNQRLTVRAGRAQVAMAVDSVAEVIRAPRITRMPHGPPGLLGIAHLRGVVLPVVSLGTLLGEGAGSQATRVVVMRRDPPIGLAVDSVETLTAVEAGEATAKHGQLLLHDESGARWFDIDGALQAQFAAFRSTRRAPDADPVRSVAALASEVLAFLTLTLVDQTYGLSLDAVVEVIAVPSTISAMPHSETALLGVFALRGFVLPVVSLRALLGLPMRPLAGDERLIVVALGEHKLALLVDGVNAIVRAPKEALQPAPSLFNRGAGEARIDVVLPLSDGRGVLSILTPARILADDRIAVLLAESTDQKDNDMTGATSMVARERFLVIHLGQERYGLPIAAVDEVVRLPEGLTRLPKAPDYVMGVMNLRGKVIPVIDQGSRFAAVGERSAAQRVVVVTLGRLQAGFTVDAVSQILEVDVADLMPAPELSDGQDRLFDRVATVDREGDVILLIDPQALLDRAEADLLSDLTAKSRTS